MKTTNNVQKTGIRKMITTTTVAAILASAFLTTSVKSQDALKQPPADTFARNTIELTSLQKIASNNPLVEVKQSGMPHPAELKVNHQVFWLEDESEEMLAVESWMISNKYFNSADSLNSEYRDKPMEVESWMTDKNIWK